MREALEAYSNAAQILLNLYGPVHKDIGVCYMKIASIHYQIKEFEGALVY